jgi:hypothetical protein
MAESAGRTTSEVDWRLAADPADLREYDAFGPWIEPVGSAADVPRRFLPHYPEHAGARFLLKIPRDEDRTALRPGMDLYRAVLAVHNDSVSLLQLREGVVESVETGWEQVVATRYSVQQLLARWTLLLDDGTTIDLDHNSAAAGRLRPAVDYVHDQVAASAVPGWRTPLPLVTVGEDFFAGRLNQLRRRLKPPVVPIHLERGNRLCRDEHNAPRLSNGLLLVDTPGELVIVARGEPARARFFPADGSDVTWIPYERLTSFTVVPPPRRGGPSFHVLELRGGRQVIRQWCLDRPDAAVKALKDRGVPQDDGDTRLVGLR